MRGIQADACARELAVTAAEGALPVPRLQHSVSPAGITTTLDRNAAGIVKRGISAQNGVGVEPDGFQHVWGDGIRKVARDQHSRGVHDQNWVGEQGCFEQ